MKELVSLVSVDVLHLGGLGLGALLKPRHRLLLLALLEVVGFRVQDLRV